LLTSSYRGEKSFGGNQMSEDSRQPEGTARGARRYLLAGRWRILPDENRIVGPQLDQRIADKFMRVLVHLCEHPGVVGRDELMAAVWPDTVVVDEVLTRAVSELRKLFGDDPRAPRIIETIPKRGYRLLASVEPLLEEAAPLHGGSGARRRAWTIARRRMPLVGLAVAALTAMAFGVLIQRSAGPSASIPSMLQLTSLSGVEEYPTLTPQGDRLVFAWEGDSETPTGIFLLTVGEERPFPLTSVAGHYAYPAWSHDLRYVAYSRVSGERPGLYQVPATGGDESLLVPPRQGRPAVTPDYSPDGHWLVYAAPTGRDQGWHLERLTLGANDVEVLTEPADGGSDFRPRHSPTGDRIAFLHLTAEGSTIRVIPAAGGPVATLLPGERTVNDLAWTPDGRHMLITTNDGLWELTVGSASLRLISADRGLSCVSVARDRPLVAFTQARGEWAIWEHPLADGSPHGEAPASRPLIDSSLYDGRPAVSPDGRNIAFISQRGGENGLWITGRDGRRARLILRSPALIPDSPAWSPDGAELVFQLIRGGRRAIGVVAADGGEVDVLTPAGGSEMRPTWSADGTWIYFSHTEGGASDIWRRRRSGGGAERVTFDGGWRGRETPDGTRLLFTRAARDTEGVWSVEPGKGEPVLTYAVGSGELVDWTVGPDGVYVCRHEDRDDRRYVVDFYAFAGGEPRVVARLDSRRDPDLAYDARNRALIYTRTERLESDLVGLLDY
jgi:Tol biopolymer transport system component/DNA-binding winged helix-turn-helix (wHTH) protein